ncbi:MAG: SMP-30/gluconolactonase/LRE family protein, partial [Candidatus Halalkalibacterium sp. M3_1C_030]
MKTIQLYGLFVILIGALYVSACTDHVSDANDATKLVESEYNQATSSKANSRTFPEDVVISFDPDAGEFPEGAAMDKKGNLYVGLAPLGKILRISRDGSTETVATLGSQLLGLAVDANGIIYAAVNAPLSPDNGVWRVDPKDPMQPELLPGTENIFFPNSLTFDRRGNLYVTSTTGPPLGGGTFGKGSIWRIPPGGQAELWLADELLTGLITNLIPQPLPLGANGIVHRNRTLYVANTSKKHVVRIPIDSKGD